MPQPEIRPATAADLAAFYGQPPARSMRAFVAVLNGQPIAVAGLAYERGRPAYLFSDMKPAMRPYRRAIVRGARAMLAAMPRLPLLAVANCDEPNAGRFLERLGFRWIATTARGEIFRFDGGA